MEEVTVLNNEKIGSIENNKFIFNLSDVDVFEKGETLFFKISDVAKCIGYSSPDNWNRWFDNEEVLFRKIDGIDKPVKYMAESALYRVLIKSNVEKAILGISKNKVGSIANKFNLKTEENGMWVKDKAKNSEKEIETFRYYESAVESFRNLIG